MCSVTPTGMAKPVRSRPGTPAHTRDPLAAVRLPDRRMQAALHPTAWAGVAEENAAATWRPGGLDVNAGPGTSSTGSVNQALHAPQRHGRAP